MQIVALDSKPVFSNDIDIKPLKELGVLSMYPRTEPALIRQRIRGADIVLVNNVVLDREAILSSSSLKLICLMGNDLSKVDLKAAADRGISVCYVPDHAAAEMAQHAAGLLLELCLHIGYHDRLIRRGAWCSSQDYCWWEKEPVSPAGKTAGIIGCGAVGQETAKLFRAFGMEVLGYDVRDRDAFPGSRVSLSELLDASDVIVLCCPVSSDTVGFVDAAFIAKMRPGALLLNISSGRLVNEPDIVQALETGALGGYGTDCVSTEPVSVHNPLLRAPNCVISAHCSASSFSARKKLAEAVTANISAFLAGAPVNLVY